jgi:type IV pilus assembly protein PilP
MSHWARCRALLPALAALALAGCFERDVQEVRLWMAQVESQARVAVPSLREPKSFTPFAYAVKDLADPFSATKLQADLARTVKSNGGIKPDTQRRKELLENFPLDMFKMVGSLQKNGINYALLQVDKSVHRVELGQHIGQNFGLITHLSESEISIREIVQDAGGEWVERMAKIELQGSVEKPK